jgi:hypothetical protein
MSDTAPGPGAARRPVFRKLPFARGAQARDQPLGRPAAGGPRRRRPALRRTAPQGRRHQRKDAGPDPGLAGAGRLSCSASSIGGAAARRVPADAAGRGDQPQDEAELALWIEENLGAMLRCAAQDGRRHLASSHDALAQAFAAVRQDACASRRAPRPRPGARWRRRYLRARGACARSCRAAVRARSGPCRAGPANRRNKGSRWTRRGCGGSARRPPPSAGPPAARGACRPGPRAAPPAGPPVRREAASPAASVSMPMRSSRIARLVPGCGGGSSTKVPMPWRVSTSPAACRCEIASRTTERLTPYCAMIADSVGSRSPGFSSAGGCAHRCLRRCRGRGCAALRHRALILQDAPADWRCRCRRPCAVPTAPSIPPARPLRQYAGRRRSSSPACP